MALNKGGIMIALHRIPETPAITNAGLRAYCAAYAFYSDGVRDLLK